MKKKYFSRLTGGIIVIMLALILVLPTNLTLSKRGEIDKDAKLVSSLLNSPYTLEGEGELQEGAGLSNPWNVGVKKSDLESKDTVYVPSDSIVLHTINAAVNGTDNKDDTLALKAAIAEAKTKDGELTKIVLPKGDLDFIEGMNPDNRGYAIDMSGLRNVILQGDDTTLYMHGDFSAINMENCENVVLTGINIDWGTPPFSTAVIQSISDNNKIFTVKVNDGYKIDSDTKIAAFLEFNNSALSGSQRFAPRRGGNDIYGDVKNVTYKGGQILEIEFNSVKSKAPINTLVVLRYKIYEHDAIFVNHSKNISFDQVNIYSAPGMGVRAYSSENLYFNSFNTILKPGTDRLMTVTADAIHTIDCKGDLVIQNSIFENCGDDALNTHSMYQQLMKKLGKDKLYVSNPRGYHFAPEVGDEMEISARADLSVIQNVTVKAVESAIDGFNVTFNEEISDKVVTEESKGNGDVIANITRSTKLVYTNNLVRNKRCRGILIQTRFAKVTNNTFSNLSDAGILMTSDTGEWYESLPSHNVVIENNKFISNNLGKGGSDGDITAITIGKDGNYGAVGVQKNLAIKNNFIANSMNSGIYINSAKDVDIEHNLISNVGLDPKSKGFNAGIGLSYLSDSRLIKNKVMANDSEEFKALIAGAAVDTGTITITANDGFSSNDLNFEEQDPSVIGKLKSGQVITLGDNSVADWLNVDNSVEMVGFSDADQSEVTPSESDFKVNFLKMTWDDSGVYFGFDVTDDELIWNDSSYWLGDGVEIFITTDLVSTSPLDILKFSNDSCTQIFMSDASGVGSQVVSTRSSEAVMENKDLFNLKLWNKSDSSGYLGEGFIPFAAIPGLKEQIEKGENMSMCFRFGDSDSDGGLQIQVSNAQHPVEFNKYVPKRMPKISFVTEKGGNN